MFRVWLHWIHEYLMRMRSAVYWSMLPSLMRGHLNFAQNKNDNLLVPQPKEQTEKVAMDLFVYHRSQHNANVVRAYFPIFISNMSRKNWNRTTSNHGMVFMKFISVRLI